MRSIILICAALALSGCGKPMMTNYNARRPLILPESYMVYQQDSRTGVCFMSTASRTYGGFYVRTMTEVGCSTEVLEQIRLDKRLETETAGLR